MGGMKRLGAYIVIALVFAAYFAVVGWVVFRDPAFMFTSFWVFASDFSDPWAWIVWSLIVGGAFVHYCRERGLMK